MARTKWSIHSTKDFFEMGLRLMGRERSRASQKTLKRQFASWFGAEPVFVAISWLMLAQSGWLSHAGRSANPVHLLWAHLWLFVYSTEEVHAIQVGVDEKTFREKVWFYVEGLARLDKTLVSDFQGEGGGGVGVKYSTYSTLFTNTSNLSVYR